MEKLINSIVNKDFESAEKSLKEEIASIVEKKLYEKKKMLAANDSKDVPFKTDVERTGSVKAQRKPLKGVTRVIKDVKEAVVHKDGLVHLTTGENILPSVYKLRRGLMESSTGFAHISDRLETLADKFPKGHKIHKHIKAAYKAMEEHEAEDVNMHMKHAEDIADAEKKKDIKEDCGLAPDKEALLHAALDKARMLIEPKLDTTAPPVDRTKVDIPKGVRPADRLTAPDLGPKEDEWCHGKKLEEDTLEEGRGEDVSTAFMSRKKMKKGTLSTDGNSVKYHNSVIAKHDDENSEVHVTTAGFGHHVSTRRHINKILKRLGSPELRVKGGKLMHGDKEIDSKDTIKVKR